MAYLFIGLASDQVNENIISTPVAALEMKRPSANLNQFVFIPTSRISVIFTNKVFDIHLLSTLLTISKKPISIMKSIISYNFYLLIFQFQHGSFHLQHIPDNKEVYYLDSLLYL